MTSGNSFNNFFGTSHGSTAIPCGVSFGVPGVETGVIAGDIRVGGRASPSTPEDDDTDRDMREEPRPEGAGDTACEGAPEKSAVALRYADGWGRGPIVAAMGAMAWDLL